VKADSTFVEGIYLRPDGLDAFLGELALLTIEGQARQLGMRSLNLYRARRGHRIGDRTVVAILTGAAAIARRRRAKRAPRFEELFEIRPPRQS